jgi:hypothetical protein
MAYEDFDLTIGPRLGQDDALSVHGALAGGGDRRH